MMNMMIRFSEVHGSRRRAWFTTLVAVFLLLAQAHLSPAWARDCDPLPEEEAGARSAGRFERGLLFQVTKPGQPESHVFGTIHVGDPRVLALPLPVTRAFDRSQGLIVEVLLDEVGIEAFSAQMLLEPGKTLNGEIGPSLFERAASLLKRYSIPREAALHLRPWAVFTTLNLPPPTDLLPLDLALMKRAREEGKTVGALESIEEQTRVLGTLPRDDQIALLADTVCHYGAIQSELRELVRAYLDRDLGALMAQAEKYQASGQERYIRLMDNLLWKRNRRMVERMETSLSKGSAFVAVGALHLAGERGILALLEERGYRVSRVY